jgi:hypothetical protein
VKILVLVIDSPLNPVSQVNTTQVTSEPELEELVHLITGSGNEGKPKQYSESACK